MLLKFLSTTSSKESCDTVSVCVEGFVITHTQLSFVITYYLVCLSVSNTSDGNDSSISSSAGMQASFLKCYSKIKMAAGSLETLQQATWT